MDILFINENLGGHATMHRHVRAALARTPDVVGTFYDLPTPSRARRVVGAQVPGLARLDLDLQPLRLRLAQSAVVRHRLDDIPTGADLIHFYTQNTALLSVGKMRGTPSVVSIDATDRQNAYLLPYRRPTRFTAASVAAVYRLERRVFQAAKCIVAHSRWAADSVLGYGIPAGRIEVIPFGISVPPSPRSERPDGLPTIVFVGTSMERKGGWRLVRLWERFLAGRSRLVLVTTERVRVDPAIEVRSDVRPGDGKLDEIFAAADIYAFPSEIDAFGYGALEAMASGLPVVASGIAAVPEIVDDGVTGLIVPIGDDASFAAALERLVEDADMRQAMGEAGRRRALERFDAETTTARLIELMREAVR
jgi:glycosyltransferase involved in cell wall biosynthesis